MIPLRPAILALFLAFSAPLLAQPQAPAPAAPAAHGDTGWLYRGSDIAPDPAWRFGTLPNGLRYAVRRNALPAGQVSIRIRIDAGSLHEADNERGWAHYVEHMVFRGTETFPDREARQTWQRLGASFGSDSNARTSPTDTVYQLDLPHADRTSLDTSLNVLFEMMARARFDPAAVEGERPVILSEKNRRSELTTRMRDVTLPLYFAGLRFAQRDPIGTDETLNAATAEGLRAFYRRWYRPGRTTIVMVGDADPDMMEALIRSRFGGWRGEGPEPADPDYGTPVEVAGKVANVPYPGVPYTANIQWIRPYERVPHTMAREQIYLAETLAARIINRRLEAHARGDSAFISASVGLSRQRNIADMSGLTLTARDGRWREAMAESFAIVGDALRAPPSETEIDREVRNLRTGVTAAVQGEATVRSQVRAEQLVGAVDNGAVTTTARTVLDNFERNVAEMTPARVGAAMRDLFTGLGPRMILATPTAIEGGNAALAQGLAEARAAAPATRPAERLVSFDDLPALGAPGREISRQRIDDMDVTIVRFANGSTLTFKPTEFERGSVLVRLRFGHGQAGLAPDRPSLGWLSALVAPSGLAGLDQDGLERLLTGRRMNLSFGIDEDAFVLGGQTNAADLPDQLRLLATKLVAPHWDPALFARYRTSAVENYDLAFTSASARANRELGGFVRPNDQRFRPIEREEIANATIDQFRDFYTPLLADGPVHVVIVGDMTLDAAVEAVTRTVAALPTRPETTTTSHAAALRPPAPGPEPRTFTHRGDASQAFALIGWSTLGGIEGIRDRRALSLAANMFQVRLFDRLREAEGTTYSPNAAHLSSDTFANWGIFYAAAEIRPERAQAFFRAAREIVADLAANPAAPDEFARAQNPVVSGIERRLATNAYWIEAIENWAGTPAEIDNVRAYLSTYRDMTAEDVRRAVAAYVAEQDDWSMLVLPERATAGAPAPGAAATPGAYRR
ncbi:insulinase family protein [Sphingosinicella sp. LHD-64]|uniref:M16 family metallopeptidase n=1 Tax=Sphingosinicella sp. LHD-64 TaxID=3072139 RepID=UPI00280E2E42|nr:insulinase family protein [Sphingosinicella sp. LHD-64]MDQ8756071.1 insulinase family protein [Sphingosinicella sp. LHD-64]